MATNETKTPILNALLPAVLSFIGAVLGVSLTIAFTDHVERTKNLEQQKAAAFSAWLDPVFCTGHNCVQGILAQRMAKIFAYASPDMLAKLSQFNPTECFVMNERPPKECAELNILMLEALRAELGTGSVPRRTIEEAYGRLNPLIDQMFDRPR